MTLLEITNRFEARSVIEQIDVAFRTLPPNLMLYVSLKGIAGIFINMFALFFITLTGWEVVDGSKRRIAIKFITEEKKIQPSLGCLKASSSHSSLTQALATSASSNETVTTSATTITT